MLYESLIVIHFVSGDTLEFRVAAQKECDIGPYTYCSEDSDISGVFLHLYYKLYIPGEYYNIHFDTKMLCYKFANSNWLLIIFCHPLCDYNKTHNVTGKMNFLSKLSL